jgi:elongation factor P
MAIAVTDLRAGACFFHQGKIYRVIAYKHTKLGRGQANIKVKVKNLTTGAIVDKSFLSSQKVEEANLTRKQVIFLYQDHGRFYFMEEGSFEQFFLPHKVVGEKERFLKEGLKLSILFWQDSPLFLELPKSLEFKVVETGPKVKGNSAVNIYKKAKLENEMIVSVPLFIDVDEVVKIDTRTGEYVERGK